MSRFITLFVILCNTSFLSYAFAEATAPQNAGGGFSEMFESVFGIDSARKNPSSVADCSTFDQHGGSMGIINGFFCHMKYDMGISTTGSVTKTFAEGSFSMRVHGEINATACTGWDGVSYADTASVWVCNALSADCTKAANFARVVSACFTSASDYSVNKGALIMDSGPFNGGAGGTNAVAVSYDLGSSSTSQKITMKMLDSHNGSVFAMRMDGTRTDANHLTATMLMVNGGGTADSTHSARFAFTLDRSANTADAYFQGFGASGDSSNGLGSFDSTTLTASGDSPPSGVCITRTLRNDGSGEFDYAVSGTSASCKPIVTFPSDSLTAVSNYTYSTIVGTWNGMASSPTSI